MQKRRVKTLLSFSIFLLCASQISIADETKPDFACLYPTILKTGKNLLKGNLQEWRGKSIPGCQMQRGNGTPFSLMAPNLLINSTGTRPNYWGRTIKVPGGRTYLAGAWVKNDNAKILFWFFGNYGNPVQRLNQRIYFYSGSSQLLKNYLSAASQALLGGDPQQWHLCYRLIEIPEEVKTFHLNLMIGTYFATGKITIADPFLIDITEAADSGMTVEITGSKSIRTLRLINLYNRDTLWSKTFDRPVNNFKQEIPNTSFQHGLDTKNKFNGYLLQVEYTDGSMEAFSAPEEKSNKNLS